MAWTERVRRGARATGAALRRVGAATLTAWRVGTGLMLLAGWKTRFAATPRRHSRPRAWRPMRRAWPARGATA